VNASLSHTEAYTYDSLNRLTQAIATGNSTYNLTFAYDRWGNMTCQTNGSTNGPCPNYSFNQATNQINTSGFSYDAAGNLTGDGVNGYTYQWDAEGHLTQLTQGSTTVEINAFDAFGWRAEMNVPAWTKLQYIYDSEGRHIGNFSGSTNSWYTMSSRGRDLFQYEGNDTYFYHHNELGSTSMMTAHDGSVINDSVLLPWGQIAAGTGETLFAAFRDHDADLWPTQFRFESSDLGRWMTPDPENAGADPTNLQSWNGYSYAGNNPTTNTDPDGLAYCKQNSDGTLDLTSCISDKDYLSLDADISGYLHVSQDTSVTVHGSETTPEDYQAALAVGVQRAAPVVNAAGVALGVFATVVAPATIPGEAEALGLGLGVESGLRLPKSPIPEVAEVDEVVERATAAVGNQTVTVSSRQVAEQAVRRWVGDGAEPIYGSYGAGPQVGWKTPDGMKVARWTSAETKGYINLENKVTGGNLHVRWK